MACVRTSRADVLRQSPPLFANRFLDGLTRTPPAVLPIVWLPVIATLVAMRFDQLSPGVCLLLFAFGWGLWTLAEYVLHRWLLHWQSWHGRGQRLHFVLHGVHHVHPSDPLRVVFPPVTGIPIAVVFFVAFDLMFGVRAWPLIAAGFVSGYLVFDLIHAWVHTGKARSRPGRFLQARHMRHHFRDETKNFGVSSPLWDLILKTEFRRR